MAAARTANDLIEFDKQMTERKDLRYEYIFEQSRSHWVRYERYEIKTGKDGKKYITPAKDARPDVYNPLKEAPDIVLDALNVGC